MPPRPILDTVRPPLPSGLCSIAGLPFPRWFPAPPDFILFLQLTGIVRRLPIRWNHEAKGRHTMEDLVKVGERFTDEARFSKEEIAEFARLAGDFNPLHHDEEFARATRFRGIIACGPQTASRFLGMTATHFSKRGASLGLEFTLRFLGPARPGERLEKGRGVGGGRGRPALNGEDMRLEGRVTNPAGEAVLTGTGTVLVARSL